MARTTSTAVSTVETEAADMLARLGLTESDSKARTAALTAIGKASKADLPTALATYAAPLYSDPTQAGHAADVATAFARSARQAADAQHAFALRVVRAARKADPKVRASIVGYAVENLPESQRNARDPQATAIRQRWSRYFKAADVVDASRDAVTAGKRDSQVGDVAALKAVSRSGADVAAIAEAVRNGGDLPTGGTVVTDAAGVESGRVYGGADIVRAANRLADVLKDADFSQMTPDQWGAVDASLAKIRERLSAGRKVNVPTA